MEDLQYIKLSNDQAQLFCVGCLNSLVQKDGLFEKWFARLSGFMKSGNVKDFVPLTLKLYCLATLAVCCSRKKFVSVHSYLQQVASFPEFKEDWLAKKWTDFFERAKTIEQDTGGQVRESFTTELLQIVCVALEKVFWPQLQQYKNLTLTGADRPVFSAITGQLAPHDNPLTDNTSEGFETAPSTIESTTPGTPTPHSKPPLDNTEEHAEKPLPTKFPEPELKLPRLNKSSLLKRSPKHVASSPGDTGKSKDGSPVRRSSKRLKLSQDGGDGEASRSPVSKAGPSRVQVPVPSPHPHEAGPSRVHVPVPSPPREAGPSRVHVPVQSPPHEVDLELLESDGSGSDRIPFLRKRVRRPFSQSPAARVEFDEWSDDESEGVPETKTYRPKHVSSYHQRVYWTVEEEENLKKGVAKFGVGRWSKILRHYKFHKSRDGVRLKDKYRNLLKSGLI